MSEKGDRALNAEVSEKRTNPYEELWSSGHDRGCDLLSTPDHAGPCRCRCGKPVGEPSPGCAFHDSRPSPVPAESTGGLSITLARIRGIAHVNAIGAHARSDHHERDWLDVLHLLDRADAEHARHEAAEVARVRAEEREAAARRIEDERNALPGWFIGPRGDLLDRAARLAREADGEADR